MLIMIIAKSFEFDAAHRLPGHHGKCAHLHGHRYVVKCALRGEKNLDPDSSSYGMVRDFGDLRAIKVWLDTHRDHGYLGYHSDPLVEYVRSQGWKCFVFDLPPTAEVIAQYVYDMRVDEYQLARVKVYETPGSYAMVGG